MKRMTVVAVTKMQSGVCIAGVSESGNWVRPVREVGGALNASCLVTSARSPIRCFDTAEFDLVYPKPDPPHVEDWVTNFPIGRVAHSLSEAERIAFLSEHIDSSRLALFDSFQCSLCLVEPESIDELIFKRNSVSGKFEARLVFTAQGRQYAGDGNTRGIPCTDLKLRALGRKLLAESQVKVYPKGLLNKSRGDRKVFLALGRTRLFQDRYWPMVIGFHIVPDYDAQINYDDL